MRRSIVVLLHTGYWIMYVFLIILFFALVNIKNGPLSTDQLLYELFLTPFGIGTLLPAIIGFYTVYSFLFRKYLTKSKIASFSIFFLLACIIASMITLMVIFITPGGSKLNKDITTFISVSLTLGFIALINGILGLVMKGFMTWYDEIKLKEELSLKNYETELALIKSQLNPHFLFNTINNIDVLIHKDANRASDYLNKLSHIMRFVLYEAKAEKISLTKELEYIIKYVELQKIRASDPGYVALNIKGDAGKIMIEPMLFIPFIENAFKYSENKKTKDTVVITISVNNAFINFTCENKYSREIRTEREPGGLGNELIQKRLTLLYPERHRLEIKKNNETYSVNLSISILL